MGRNWFWPKVASKLKSIWVSGIEVTFGDRGRSSVAYWTIASLNAFCERTELRLTTKELKEFSSNPLVDQPEDVKSFVRFSPSWVE